MKELLMTAKENGLFLLTCLGIFLGLVLVARLAQWGLCKNKKTLSPARKVSFVAMLSAIAALLMYIEIPLPFAPPFYQIDLSEVPVLICTFYLGPVSGIVCEFLKILLKIG